MACELRPHLRTDARAKTPIGALVVTCAALGSPVTEVARVVAVSPRRLRDTVRGRETLDASSALLIARWVPCLWWRTLWRLGHPVGNDRRELDAVSRLALTLPWVPDDWAADLGRAALWHEVRPRPPKARRGAANGRAKLTDLDARAMRELKRAGWTHRRIARRFEVSPATVHAVVSGGAWGG